MLGQSGSVSEHVDESAFHLGLLVHKFELGQNTLHRGGEAVSDVGLLQSAMQGGHGEEL